MLRTKRITSFLLAFVMVFSIFVGTVSKADEPETTEKSKVKTEVTSLIVGTENISIENLGKYELKLQKGEEDPVEFGTKEGNLEVGETYKILVKEESYKIKSISYKDGDSRVEVKNNEFKVPETENTLKFTIQLTERKESDYKLKSLEVNGDKFTDIEDLTNYVNDYGIKLKNTETEDELSILISSKVKAGTKLEVISDTSKAKVNSVRVNDGKIKVENNTFVTPDEGGKLELDLSLTTNGSISTKVTSLKVDEGEAITTGLDTTKLKDYDLKLKIGQSKIDFDSDTDKLVEGKAYEVVSSKYDIEEVKIKYGTNGTVKVENNIFTTPADVTKLEFDITLKTKPVADVKTKVVSLKVDDKDEITTAEDLTTEKLKEYGLKLKTGETELDFAVDTGKLVKKSEYEVVSSKYDVEKVEIAYKVGSENKTFTATDNKFKVPEDATELEFKITLKTKSETDNVKILEGKDRYKTAVEIAKEAYPTAKNVIIANGEVSADALTAGPLANELEAPILLVRDNSAIQGVKDYIKDNGVEKIYVVGGPDSVSKDLLAELLAIDVKIKSERIDGKDRYETSIKVAKELKKKGYTNNIIIANGTDEKDADALAASTYATENKMPIVLTNGSVLTSEVKSGLETMDAEKATIVGGPQTVAENVINGTDLTYTSEGRIYGSTRFETSVEIAKKLTQANVKTVVVANGYKSPDALAAGPLAFTKNAAIILSTETNFIPSQSTYIGTIKNIETAYIVGGEDSVKETVKTELETLVKNSREEDK